jgi:hypothetical protein
MIFTDDQTQLNPEGLTIAYLDNLTIKIDCWRDGFNAVVHSEKEEEPLEHGLQLVHRSYPESAENQRWFVSQIPSAVREVIVDISYLQFDLMQLAASSYYFSELLISNRLLAWLLVHELYVGGRFDKDDLTRLTNTKRKEIASQLFGWGTGQDIVNTLSRVKIVDGSHDELLSILDIFSQPEKVSRILELDTVPIHLLMAWSRFTVIDRLRLFETFTKPSYPGGKDQAVRDGLFYSNLHEEIQGIGYLLDDSPDVTASLRECGSLKCLRRLHDALIERVNVQRTEIELKQLQKRYENFPNPPLKGTGSIIPISNINMLIEEGLEMQHCVLTYASRIIYRQSYIYRVMEPERATLEFTELDQDIPKLSQLKLAKNREPSQETWHSVVLWLEQSVRKLD